jgi:hypothetical protein
MTTTKTELLYDKRAELFGEGPWLDEPDRVEWRIVGGFVGLLYRSELGAWCGYLGVPPDHPWYGCSQTALDDVLDAHGGITHAGECDGHICHVPDPGEPEHLWWVGFDCAHAFDLVPGIVRALPPRLRKNRTAFHGWQYRTERYARDEVEQLAVQARQAKGISALGQAGQVDMRR